MPENLEQCPQDAVSESLPPSKQAPQSSDHPSEIPKIAIQSMGGLQQYSVTEAFRAAAETGLIRNQGAKIVLQAIVQLREADLEDARQERQSARLDSERYKENFFREQTRNAVLTERLRGELRLKKLQNVLITLGGVMLGAGIQPLLVAFSVPFCVLTLVGLALLAGGWFYPTRSGEEDQ